MKGKRKCENLNNKPPNYENLCGNDNWNGDFGNVSKRQQSARRFYDNSELYHGMCGGRGRFVLDFEFSSVHLPSVKEDRGDCGVFIGGSTFGSSNVPRFLPGDRYDCLFRESSSATARRNMSHCIDLPGPVGFSPIDQHSLFLSGYRRGPAVLDFETSTVLMSSMNGGKQPTNLSNNSPYAQGKNSVNSVDVDEKNASRDDLRSNVYPLFIGECPSSVGRVGQAK
ncbi:hypothetical protein Tco_0429063, partial [Tanacetum coccineum]